MKEYKTTKEVQNITGLSEQRIRQAAQGCGAQKIGFQWVWNKRAINKLIKQKGKRGNPKWKLKRKQQNN